MDEMIKFEYNDIIEIPSSSLEVFIEDPSSKRQEPEDEIDIEDPSNKRQKHDDQIDVDVPQSKLQEQEYKSSTPDLRDENKNIAKSIDEKLEERLTQKKELDFSLVHMLVTDLESFEFVERKGFKSFVKKLDSAYELPSRIHLKYELFPSLYKVLNVKLRSILSDVNFVTLSIDSWLKSDNEFYYISITSHFIWKNKLYSAVLETKQVEDFSISKLSTAIKEVIDNWNLEDKLVCLMTDNTINLNEAVAKLGIHYMPSFVHSLQLVAKDCFELPSIDNLIQKCKMIVDWFGSDTRFRDRIDQNPILKAALNMVTSVNSNLISVYYIVKCVLYLKDRLEESLSEHDVPTTFSSGELCTLEGCFSCLDCIRFAIDDTNCNQYSMQSLIIPTMSFVHEKLRLLENVKKKTALCELFLERMKNAIQSKLKIFESADLPLMSSILDPRMKKHGFRLPLIAVKAENLLIQESSSVVEQIKASDYIRESSEKPVIKNEDVERCSLLNFLGEHINQTYKRRTKVSTISIELESYLADPIIQINRNPMDYWKQNQSMYPNLYTLACKYLCIPAHSVPIETIFSDVVTKQRQKIEHDYVDRFIFFRQNEWLKDVDV